MIYIGSTIPEAARYFMIREALWGGVGLNRMQMTQPCRDAGPQYHQKVNNDLGPYPVGNGLSKRK